MLFIIYYANIVPASMSAPPNINEASEPNHIIFRHILLKYRQYKLGESMKWEKARHLSQDLISQFNPQLLPNSHLNLESESHFNFITLGHQEPSIPLH